MVKQHLSPEPSESYETYRRHTKIRNSGEKASAFLAELRNVVDHCGFSIALERSLRGQCVIGLLEKAVRRMLLAKPKTSKLQEA